MCINSPPCSLQHATERVERPGESQLALDGKKKQYWIDSGDRSVLRIAVWNPAAAKVQFLGLNALLLEQLGQ